MPAVDKFIQSQNTGSSVNLLSGNVYVVGSNDPNIDTSTIQFLSDIDPASLVTSAVPVPNPTMVGRTFSGDRIDFGGDPTDFIRNFVYYYAQGGAGTSRVIACDPDGPFIGRYYDPRPGGGYFQL